MSMAVSALSQIEVFASISSRSIGKNCRRFCNKCASGLAGILLPAIFDALALLAGHVHREKA